jgi:hypothetical protein
MKTAGILSLGVLLLLASGCVTLSHLNLDYLPGQAAPAPENRVTVAVLPFEDTTVNGQEDHYWVGTASLYQEKLINPLSISQLVTRGVRKEIESYGHALGTDEIYTIQIGRKDIKTLLKKIPYTQVDYLVGGAVTHFFVHQKVRFVAEVEIEAFIVRPADGETIWSKKIGHREERVPFSPDTFAPSSQAVLNKLLDKTIKDLLRNSDFRLHLIKDKR